MQCSPSIDSSGDEFPTHKKGPSQIYMGDVCWVDESALKRVLNVQLQTLKDLRILRSLKEIDGKDVEDHRNFSNARVISVVRMSRGSEGVMRILSEANQAFSSFVHFIDHEKYANTVVGKVLISIYPSLHRAYKLTFPRDIRGLARDKYHLLMGVGSMSQAVGVLTPAMFRPSTQPLY